MLESLILHDENTAHSHLFHATMEWLALSGGFMLYNRIRKRKGGASLLATKGGGCWRVACWAQGRAINWCLFCNFLNCGAWRDTLRSFMNGWRLVWRWFYC
ncbi:hypothetical protein [Kingella negevensis]|uniref:hypothetical protein n=1 Tax=Kingella negevensis TaxID=1522312 RepID=UPI001FD773F7|nr:hypothetical protein [Kingella negevensis]